MTLHRALKSYMIVHMYVTYINFINYIRFSLASYLHRRLERILCWACHIIFAHHTIFEEDCMTSLKKIYVGFYIPFECEYKIVPVVSWMLLVQRYRMCN